jgi:TRAP-type C4-dicarboxylate transport system substrate-binding protein
MIRTPVEVIGATSIAHFLGNHQRQQKQQNLRIRHLPFARLRTGYPHVIRLPYASSIRREFTRASRFASARLLTLGVALVCARPASAGGAPNLRLATVAPEGTVWARELHDWAADVERKSGGELRIKLYFGGIAGDDLEVGDRIRRGQLDGAISAGTLCVQVAPSLKVLKVIGLFQTREEASRVMGILKPTLDEEARANGFVNLAEGGLGSIIIFSRRPIATMSELRKIKLWTGLQDEMTVTQLEALGLHVLPEPLAKAAASYTAGRNDGFLTVPQVALSWQWAQQARYFTDLRLGFLFSCLLISNASFDALSVEAQAAVRSAAAELLERSEKLGRAQDDALLGGLFQKQGLKKVPVDERFRADFFEAASTVRERVRGKFVSAQLLQQVLGILADLRAKGR